MYFSMILVYSDTLILNAKEPPPGHGGRFWRLDGYPVKYGTLYSIRNKILTQGK